MHKNITISEEEYAEVISQLEEINKEKRKILEENKAEILAFYQECRSNGEKLANDWIMNLVLLLTRKNQIIFGKISYECKNYSSQFNSPFVRQTVNQGINSWMNDMKDESTKFLEDEKNFSNFKEKITLLRSEMASNNDLLKEISDILTNEEILLRKKKIYERLTPKKDVKQKKKRLPFMKNNVTMK